MKEQMLLKYLIKKVLQSFEGNLQKYESHSIWNWSNFFYHLSLADSVAYVSYAFSPFFLIVKWLNDLADHY